MPAVHLRRLARNGFDLDADLLTFLGAVHRLVVNLDAGDHTDVHKLRRARTRSHEQAHLPQVNTNGPPPQVGGCPGIFKFGNFPEELMGTEQQSTKLNVGHRVAAPFAYNHNRR